MSAYERTQTRTSTSSSIPRKLADGSWIRKPEEEDEAVDRDPNFGKTILGHVSTVTSDRFTSSQDELNKTSTSPGYRTKTTTNKWSSPTSSVSSVTASPKTSFTSSTVTDDGKKTETTTTTTTRSFTDRVFSDGKSSTKGSTYSPLSQSSSKVTETTITTIKGAEDLNDDALTSSTTVTRTSVVETPKEDVFPSTTTTKGYSTTEDKLYDTLLPKSMTDPSSPISKTSSLTRREFKTVESSVSDNYRPYSPTYTSSGADYSITSSSRTFSSSSPDTSDRYSSTRTYSSSGLDSGDKYNTSTRTYSSSGPDTSYEYTTINSPSVYTTTSTTYKDSRMDDYMDGDSYSTKSSIQTVYSAPERTVLEKDLCSYCRKPFNSEAKMVLDDMKINCHASCFKCEVCSNNLGNLKAGDSLWIYRRTVHCDRCFDVTREQWRR